MLESTHTIPASIEDEKNRGVQAVLLACVLNAIVSAGFYFARLVEPEFSMLTGIYIRVVCNIVFIAPILTRKRSWKIRAWRGNRALWFWAFSGVGTTTMFFLAIPLIGAGMVSFLNAGSGVFIALFAPLVARQKTSLYQWMGILGCILGLFLISNPDLGAMASWGASMAILSGLSSGIGYLMIARSRKTFSPETVMLHWSATNFVFLSLFLLLVPMQWPAKPETWMIFLVMGLTAAASQYLATVAYQSIPSAVAACLFYIGPILSVVIDIFVFKIHFPARVFAGCVVVLFFGLYLPLRKKDYSK